jgi:hypothetical protein
VSDEIVFLYKYFLCLSDKHFTGGLGDIFVFVFKEMLMGFREQGQEKF